MGKITFYKFLILILLSHLTSLCYSQEYPWKLKTQKEGITIYNRSVDYSRIKELKMTTTLKTSLGALVNILDDVTRYPEWMYGCKSGEKISPEDGAPSYDRATLQFPKPIAYRVMFTRSVIYSHFCNLYVLIPDANQQSLPNIHWNM